MGLNPFSDSELKLFDEVKNATLSNISEWDFRYKFPKTKKQKERADELHWEASMRYYLSQTLPKQDIIFRESSRGVDLKERDCHLITGIKFTAELRFTYREPPRCWNVFEPTRIRTDTNLYLILLPNDGNWKSKKIQGFPDLMKKVEASAVKINILSQKVALAMVKF